VTLASVLHRILPLRTVRGAPDCLVSGSREKVDVFRSERQRDAAWAVNTRR